MCFDKCIICAARYINHYSTNIRLYVFTPCSRALFHFLVSTQSFTPAVESPEQRSATLLSIDIKPITPK